ncbi:MAG: hypothetical protein MZV63_63830 [Marinilabiliales bacterium]|nr:hypothetical protein [Marinilabiliales bacterium]
MLRQVKGYASVRSPQCPGDRRLPAQQESTGIFSSLQYSTIFTTSSWLLW